MTSAIVIAGFPSSNRVPGAYGEVLTGQGGQSAANLPKSILCTGQPTSVGTIVPDVQVVPILSTADADNYAGPGSEGACQLYDALALAGNQGTPLFYCTAKPAGGATAATTNVRFNGTATGAGAVIVRIAGQTISVGIAVNDTAATIAANLQQAVAGFAGGRLPITATNSTSYCVLTCRTSGVRGMQQVVFLDTTQMAATGVSATLYRTWATGGVYVVGDQVVPLAVPNGLYFKCTVAGTAGGSEPTWPTTVGTTVTDGGVTWTCWGSTANGNVPTTALFLGNSAGLETYTNLLATLYAKSYDRIALAANDSTSVAAWKTQIDQLMLAPTNFLQHAIAASNGTEAAAVSLAQVTLNDTSFEWFWQQSGETSPSRTAAAVTSVRALAETTNPNSDFDNMILSTVVPQSQIADQPQLPVLINATNNSVTCLKNADGNTVIVRAITTKSLTGGAADYSTLDVGQRVVPDFILQDGKLYWSTVLRPANPVSAPDVQGKSPPSGVLTPSRVVSAYTSKLNQYALGVLTSTPLPNAPATVPPIVIAPVPGDVTAMWDPIAKRIMMAENVNVMPLDHAIGISVRQVS